MVARLTAEFFQDLEMSHDQADLGHLASGTAKQGVRLYGGDHYKGPRMFQVGESVSERMSAAIMRYAVRSGSQPPGLRNPCDFGCMLLQAEARV